MGYLELGTAHYLRNTFFIDMDGTLVRHSYPPFDQEEVLLDGVEDLLTALKEQNSFNVLTTARAVHECRQVLLMLWEKYQFKFDAFIYDLPTGKRTVINDTGSAGNCKSYSISVPRDKGCKHLDLETLK